MRSSLKWMALKQSSSKRAVLCIHPRMAIFNVKICSYAVYATVFMILRTCELMIANVAVYCPNLRGITNRIQVAHEITVTNELSVAPGDGTAR